MSDMAYAVHTRTCIYLLDDDGICRWTLAPSGVPAQGADRCVGAQFVACLDLRVEGGLVGELMIGAAALFARVENGRFVLLRTPMIEYVEFRSGEEEEPAPPEPQTSRQTYPLDEGGYAIANPTTDPYPEDGQLYPPPPAYVTAPPRAGSYEEIDVEAEDLEEMVDVEELVTFSEVTLTIPLYRPDAQEAIPFPPRRGMIGPGRRLR
jgi:hypothetical protein